MNLALKKTLFQNLPTPQKFEPKNYVLDTSGKAKKMQLEARIILFVAETKKIYSFKFFSKDHFEKGLVGFTMSRVLYLLGKCPKGTRLCWKIPALSIVVNLAGKSRNFSLQQ